MRALLGAVLVVGALVAAASLVGCPAAHDDYPNASCKTDSDCYKGEKCMNASVCVPTTPIQDMAIPPGSDLASFDLANATAIDMTSVDM
jgi:hypothetical protein